MEIKNKFNKEKKRRKRLVEQKIMYLLVVCLFISKYIYIHIVYHAYIVILRYIYTGETVVVYYDIQLSKQQKTIQRDNIYIGATNYLFIK